VSSELKGELLAGEDQDVGRGAFAVPVAGGQARPLAEVAGSAGVGAGQPVVEQAEGDADAGGDGVVRWVGLCLAQDRGGQGGVVAGDGLDRQPQRGDGQVACVADGGEPGHVVPFDRAAGDMTTIVNSMTIRYHEVGKTVITEDGLMVDYAFDLLVSTVRFTLLGLDVAMIQAPYVAIMAGSRPAG
jgi:hypothetical protein